MEWSKFFAIIAIIFIFLAISQLFQFRREFMNLDKEQIIPEQFSDKWERRMSKVIVWSILGTIFGLVSIIFSYYPL